MEIEALKYISYPAQAKSSKMIPDQRMIRCAQAAPRHNSLVLVPIWVRWINGVGVMVLSYMVKRKGEQKKLPIDKEEEEVEWRGLELKKLDLRHQVKYHTQGSPGLDVKGYHCKRYKKEMMKKEGFDVTTLIIKGNIRETFTNKNVLVNSNDVEGGDFFGRTNASGTNKEFEPPNQEWDKQAYKLGCKE
ncbi:hypothetical protein VNO77_22777 [Canavalia gladiata]|uniref:Uncharacterized protein n=1 Tax=Canavalia gladiata TaxID=3824 RepID=A0AAN9L6I8_CANGL